LRGAIQTIQRNGVALAALVAALGACGIATLAWLDSGDARPLDFKLSRAGSDEILTKRIDIKDPMNDSNAYTTKRLLKYGPFTLRGECRDLGSFSNHVTIQSSKTAFAVGQTETTDPDTLPAMPITLAPAEGSNNVGAANPRSVTAFTPGGQFISVQIFEVNRGTNNDANDCSFWVQGDGKR
jgi:hypothetical protein